MGVGRTWVCDYCGGRTKRRWGGEDGRRVAAVFRSWARHARTKLCRHRPTLPKAVSGAGHGVPAIQGYQSEDSRNARSVFPHTHTLDTNILIWRRRLKSSSIRIFKFPRVPPPQPRLFARFAAAFHARSGGDIQELAHCPQHITSISATALLYAARIDR
jgi:hypothetical protein